MQKDKTTYAPFVLFEYEDDPGNYCLSMTDAHMGEHESLFEEHDREPGGYGWADVALQAMRSSASDLEERLTLDPEAGSFVAYGDDVDALRSLGALLHSAFHDEAQLAELLADAPFEYD